jgi:hypothetical protein
MGMMEPLVVLGVDLLGGEDDGGIMVVGRSEHRGIPNQAMSPRPA